jgi:peptidylprolyl isomerase
MQKAKHGDKVSVHYQGRLTDGSIFDSSAGREPLVFTVGAGHVIKGFDVAVIDMAPGQKKTVQIPAAEAYGERDESYVMEYPVSEFPADITPQIGMELQMGDNSGNVFPVVIIEVNEDTVLLDGNPALAGKDLVFDIELVSIG